MYQMSHYQPCSPSPPRSNPSLSYSYLESIANSAAESRRQEYVVSAPVVQASPIPGPRLYAETFSSYSKLSSLQYLLFQPQSEYHFTPDTFLKPGKEGMFVGSAEDIRQFVEEAFEKMLGSAFPEDIKISVLDAAQFRNIAPSPSTIGLSINRRKHGLMSEIFVLNDSLARVMLTIGHELGHVFTETLENKHDEEAKAYAFSLAWMNLIKDHNIADLADAIVTERPAENGLHNVAFFFVDRMMRAGAGAIELWKGLVEGKLFVLH